MRRIYLLPISFVFGVFVATGGQIASSQAGTVKAANGKVRVYTPTISTAPSIDESDAPSVEKTKTIVIRERYYHPFYTRSERLARAFGHRYPGFIKQYSGPKYPF